MTAAAPLDLARPARPESDPRAPTLEQLIAQCADACAGVAAVRERGTVSYRGRPCHEEVPVADWGSYAGGRPDDDPAWRRE